MFEQSPQSYQYQYEPVAEPLKEGDPFYNYEIRNWDLGPRLIKILVISTVLNVAALLIVAQTSLLTMKGCDSPLVGSMCQALDTVYVGSMLFGTDREYVDVAYDKTDLGDVDITYVDVTGAEKQKLYYPANYWQLANPEKYDPVTGQPIDQGFVGLESQNIPGMTENGGFPTAGPFPTAPPSSGSNLFNTPQHLPKSNPNAVTGDFPGTHTATGPRNRPGKRGGQTPGNTAANGADGQPDENHTAEVKPSPSPSPSVEPSAPVDPNTYNSRPLIDWAHQTNDLMAQSKFRLDSPYRIRAITKLGKDGKFSGFALDEQQTQFPDEATKKVLLGALSAISDSGRLKVLSELSGKNLNLTIVQDGTNLNAIIESEMETDMRANSVKSNFDLLIALSKQAKSGATADQNDKDDLQLLQNVVVETAGKKVVLRFVSPKDPVLMMFQRKLDEEKTKASQPSGNTGAKPTENTALK